MKYAYCRVSTREQNVNQQAQKLMDQYSIDAANIVQEVWTGKSTDRPALQQLLSQDTESRRHAVRLPHQQAWSEGE